MTTSPVLLRKEHIGEKPGMDLHDDEPLCHRGLDLNTAYQNCPKPKWKLHEPNSCVRYVECSDNRGTSHDPGCITFHDYRFLVYYEYLCDNINMELNDHQQHESGSGQESEEGSGDVLERLYSDWIPQCQIKSSSSFPIIRRPKSQRKN